MGRLNARESSDTRRRPRTEAGVHRGESGSPFTALLEGNARTKEADHHHAGDGTAPGGRDKTRIGKTRRNVGWRCGGRQVCRRASLDQWACGRNGKDHACTARARKDVFPTSEAVRGGFEGDPRESEETTRGRSVEASAIGPARWSVRAGRGRDSR
eukprot:GHVN01033925.1.p2 GENE.GHVN01033925.1~~GHVN01033925.1.p2  ORF type:complete len:156 (-),score=3.57 GHVN01033925.1:485-952(-)